MVSTLVLLLLSCGVSDQAEPSHTASWSPAAPERAPGVAPLTLCQPPFLVPGGPAEYTVTGAMPGETVHLLFGTALGPGACPAALGGLCLDVTGGRTRVIASGVADAAGVATVVFPVPAAVPVGASMAIQAIARRGPGGVDSVASNAVLGPIVADLTLPGGCASGDICAGDDTDGDGVRDECDCCPSDAADACGDPCEGWPTGLDERPSNPTCVAPDPPGPSGGVQLTPAFGVGFVLDEPTFMTHPPGDDSYWYVFFQDGILARFENLPSTTSYDIALDISAQVRNRGAEQGGAMGLAFHPDFAVNGQLFLTYTKLGEGPLEDGYSTVLTRVTSFDGGVTFDPATEETLIELWHETVYHNGGHAEFGPDGMLYYAMGDGGGSLDPNEYGQDPFTLFSTIMRIDPDGGVPYGIPPDNPFADGLDGAPEVWAYGVRNPWRYAIDWATGEMWAADVGSNYREEVTLIEKGGNHGWSVTEGTRCIDAGCDTTGMVPPVTEWAHSGLGLTTIIGGMVYRGSAIPELYGKYLYMDYFGGGPLYALSRDGEDVEVETLIEITGHNVASFAQDLDGELYLLDHVSGEVLLLEPAEGGGSDFPTLLSETGCVDPLDPTQPASGLIPFTVQVELWSDGLDKSRHMALPDGTTISVDARGDFELPEGTVLMKDFRHDGQLVETRLFMRHSDGVWAGYSYEWAPDESDATLLEDDKVVSLGDLDHTFPSRGQCLDCHTDVAGDALGPETLQLNSDFTYPNGRTANQMSTLDHIGMFDVPVGDPASLVTMPAIDDLTATSEDRARAYLHANCASCHQPGGTGGGPADFHYLSADPMVCDVPPTGSDMGIPGALLFAPGDPDASIVLARMLDLAEFRMPPLATSVVDPDGTALIEEWILDTPSCAAE